MRRIGTMILGSALLFTVSAMAEDIRSDVSVEGTGFFTKESNNRGISQRATDAGGFLVGYRYHFNDWIAAEANYGYQPKHAELSQQQRSVPHPVQSP